MNTEKLQKIKAECEMLLDHPMYRNSVRSLAGFKTTIAAIEFYLNSNGISQGFLYGLICEILTAWKGAV